MPKRKNITTTIAELQTSQSSFVTTQTLDQKLTRKESPLKSLKTPTVTSKVFADTCTTPISSQTSIPKESPLKSIRLTPKAFASTAASSPKSQPLSASELYGRSTSRWEQILLSSNQVRQ
ncbi:uncharacterized protein [Ptychodera flava]|uniref:uncharacterized protein isoform X1 n=1 Tax=Ptychodera flava TaxID=63121 RepID=UPI003969DAD2